MRPSSTRFFSALLLLTLTSCASIQHPAPEPRGTLRFSGSPADASIEVDEQGLGPLSMFAEKGLLLLPGQHRVIARREGYFPGFYLVDIEVNTVSILEVKLRPVPE